MGNKLTKISSYRVGSGGVSSFQFDITSGAWDYLVLHLSLRTNAGTNYSIPYVRFNNDSTAAAYGQSYFYGLSNSNVGGGFDSDTAALIRYQAGSGSNSNIFGGGVMYINDVSGSRFKSYFVDSTSPFSGSSTIGFMGSASGQWKNTSAITSITISGAGSTILEHSQASLYGMKVG